MTDASFIMWVQQFSTSFLDFFFINITKLGNAETYMLAIPLIYWCISKTTAFKFAIFFLINCYVNSTIKGITNVPRPSADEVRVLYEDSTMGSSSFPSGHTQGTAGFWGYMATLIRKQWFTILSIIITALVGISRLYLGVHYPIDVVAGLFLAVLVLFLFHKFYNPITNKLSRLSFEARIALSILIPLMLLISPAHDKAMLIGFSMGLLIGYQIEQKYLDFDTKGQLWKQGAKFILGIAVFFGLRIILKQVFGVIGFNDLSQTASDVVRYCIIGLWASYFAPLTFVKLKLSHEKKAIYQ